MNVCLEIKHSKVFIMFEMREQIYNTGHVNLNMHVNIFGMITIRIDIVCNFQTNGI